MQPIRWIFVWAFLMPVLLSSPAQSFEKEKFIGKTKTYLLSCAGVPERAMKSGGTEFLTYSHSRGSSGVVTGFANFGYGHYGPGFVSRREHTCQINFQIRNGRIVDATERWGGGFISGPMACNSIVENCK